MTTILIRSPSKAIQSFRNPILSPRYGIHIETAFAEGSMARKTKAARLKEQRERQQGVRDAQKADKRPGRDDFARYCFRWTILMAAKHADTDPRPLNALEIALIDGLVAQGFDREQTDKALGVFIDKYVDEGWDFRIKRHLDPPLSLFGFAE